MLTIYTNRPGPDTKKLFRSQRHVLRFRPGHIEKRMPVAHKATVPFASVPCSFTETPRIDATSVLSLSIWISKPDPSLSGPCQFLARMHFTVVLVHRGISGDVGYLAGGRPVKNPMCSSVRLREAAVELNPHNCLPPSTAASNHDSNISIVLAKPSMVGRLENSSFVSHSGRWQNVLEFSRFIVRDEVFSADFRQFPH